jgi:hypothetical protein
LLLQDIKQVIAQIVCLVIRVCVVAQPKIPAFPETQFFRAHQKKGGRGGKVRIVTTTPDYGDHASLMGSLRDSIEATMPRPIVFEVSCI